MSEPESQPIDVRNVGEEYAYLAEHGCACGGAWEVVLQACLNDGSERYLVDQLSLRCSACGAESAIQFRVDTEAAGYRGGLKDVLRDLFGDDADA